MNFCWATHMPDVASHLILMCNPMRRKCHCDFNVTRVSIDLTDLWGHTGSCERHQPKLSWLLLRFPQRIPNAGKGRLFRLLRVPRMLLWEQLWDTALHVVMGQHCLIWALQMMPSRNVWFCLGRAQQLSFSWVGNAKERCLSIHTWKCFSTNGSVFAYPSFSTRHEPLTLNGSMCQPPHWSQDRHLPAVVKALLLRAAHHV